ncbi:MAG TPA: M20/M25/M40 family metallo-hydrolase [Fimbriimonas sp.]
MSRLFLPCLLVAPFSLAGAQGDPATVERIIDRGKHNNQVMVRLRDITDIGPRLTGSPNLYRAQLWAMSQFRKWGLKDVRLEKWGEVPVGFERGSRQVGRMVRPFLSDFQFTTPNWAPGTNGLVRAKAVAAPKTLEELQQRQASLKGAWLVLEGNAGMRGARMPDGELKKALDAAGIAGYVSGAADERVHSHGTWRDKSYDVRPKDLQITVRKSDYDRIVRNIRFGREVELEFDIENRWFKGPVPQYNVVADIKGTERPDEMVIVCGHFDSWNSPGSQGANDNGTGSATAMEAARLLMAAGAKPKRTIRFVLWSGEEQGLLGSRGYVATHKDEMDKISAVLNDDGGTGYHGGYVGIETMKEAMEAAFAPTVRAFPEFPMEFSVAKQMPAGGSSDHAPFNWEGVPGFFTMEKGEKANYGKVWHTQFDRYEEAVPEYLVQSSTNHAIVAYNLACAPTLLARGPKPERRRDAIKIEPVGADHVYESPDLHDGDHDHSDDYILELVDRVKRAAAANFGLR